MNHALRRISLTCLILFVALLVNLNYWQGFKTNYLASAYGNRRTFNAEQDFQRGPIVTADGKVIAKSYAVPGAYQRLYYSGKVYAPVTGYDTPFGKTGIEAAENNYLAGNDSQQAVRNLIQIFTGKPEEGATVQLTINSQVQQAAYQALAAAPHPPNSAGDGAVAIDPATGAILALVSYPSFNPNLLTDLKTLSQNDKQLLRAPGNPLLNRAIDATFHPGSSFKVITASTAFGTGKYNPNSTFPAPTVLPLPDTSNVVHNDGDTGCANGDPPLIEAFALSCNTAYGGLGLKLGANALLAQADKFGFNSSLDIPAPVAPSVFPANVADAYVAYSAIGQFDDAETPLQEAMVAASIANHGVLMKPYLVQRVTGPQFSILDAAHPTVLHQAVSSQVAGEMTNMMEQVVDQPYGTAYNVPGIRDPGLNVAGKTGTAETSNSDAGVDDAVFTCFAPASNPQIAVGVIIGGGGFGAAAAAPVAVAMIKAYKEVLSSQWNQ